MSIPANITTEWQALQAQVAANTPLLAASRATRVAVKLNAAQLVSDVQNALTAPNNLLDTFVAPTDPAAMVSGVLNVGVAATDQSNLALLRGLAGRVASNLDQLP